MVNNPTSAAMGGEAVAKFGRKMFDILFERFCEGDYEIEINDLITTHAVEVGLVDKVKFDPEEHTDASGLCEVGDDYYTISRGGEQALTHPAEPIPCNSGNTIVNGEEYVPIEAYREAMSGWKAANATPPAKPAQSEEVGQ